MAILQVPCTKSKGFVEIETNDIPEAVYAEALLQGLKVLVNRGASKITKETYPDEAQLKAAAQAKAEEQKAEILSKDEAGNYTGNIKLTGQKAKSKEKGEVITEARNLARGIVKDLMKKNGIKISHVKAADITAAANDLLEQDPSLIEQARAAIEARKANPVTSKIDIKALIHTDPTLVAKDEARKAKEKANKPLSAKQAGKVKPRKSAQPTA